MPEQTDSSKQPLAGEDALVDAFGELPHELADLLMLRPAPISYRERLREQLLAAARDERTFARRRAFSRRWLTATVLAMVVLSSVGGLVIWRLLGVRQRQLPARV